MDLLYHIPGRKTMVHVSQNAGGHFPPFGAFPWQIPQKAGKGTGIWRFFPALLTDCFQFCRGLFITFRGKGGMIGP